MTLPKTRSVDEDVEDFCGWPFLSGLIKATRSAFMQALIAALFETGGRISEVLALRKHHLQLDLHPDVLVVKRMPLLKRFRKVGLVKKWKCVGHCKKRWNQKPAPFEFQIHKIQEYDGWATKGVEDFRTFPIRLSEPLTAHLITYSQTVRKPNGLLFPIKRSAAFVRVRKVGEALNTKIPFAKIHSSQLYDHFFRAERACQLAFDYGFERDDLRAFFGWKPRRPDMVDKYASVGWIGLAKKMGVKV